MIAPCAEVRHVGDRPTVRFTFVPSDLNPTAESTAVTVRWRKPNSATVSAVNSPDISLVHSTALVDGFLESYWDFTFPTPFDVGSRRAPWVVECESRAGITKIVDTECWVEPAAF